MTAHRFTGRATGLDPEGYYIPRWDRAQPIVVEAEDADEAGRKARKILGTHPRHGTWRREGSGWTIRWDKIEEIPDPVVPKATDDDLRILTMVMAEHHRLDPMTPDDRCTCGYRTPLGRVFHEHIAQLLIDQGWRRP